MSLRNLNIGPRSALGFGLVGLIVLLLGLFALGKMADMRKEADEVDKVWLPSITALAQLNENMLRLRALTLRMVVIQDPQVVSKTGETLAKLATEIEQNDVEYERNITSADERAIYQRFKGGKESYLKLQVQAVDFAKQGQRDQAVAILNGEINNHADTLTKGLHDLLVLNEQGADKAAVRANEAYQSGFFWVLVTIALASLLTGVLAWLFTRSIVGPLGEAVRVAETVASGDLTQSIQVNGKDEPARLLTSLKAMQQNLRSTIQSIADSSSQLASASEELSAVTEDSTRGLHQQSNEIEQAATAVNEMTTAVEEVARNAVTTSEASRESDRTTQRGREQVRQTVDSISHLADDVTTTADQVEQLADKVRDISKVLDVIRAIAEQTNLLALNAAIEAARAGDAGRGFAVVADEVRALAHRTQQSTQEIEQMISGIRQGTDQAVNAMQSSNSRARSTLDVAKAAGLALEEIAAAISEINERNMVIASASEEQAQVAREVDRNLVNIRDLALQSSAGANQTSAASQELSRLAVALSNLISRFTV